MSWQISICQRLQLTVSRNVCKEHFWWLPTLFNDNDLSWFLWKEFPQKSLAFCLNGETGKFHSHTISFCNDDNSMSFIHSPVFEDNIQTHNSINGKVYVISWGWTRLTAEWKQQIARICYHEKPDLVPINSLDYTLPNLWNVRTYFTRLVLHCNENLKAHIN